MTESERWYIYGYFLGDGSMRNSGGSYVVSFYSKDEYPISRFAELYGVSLKRYSNKDLYYISIFNKELYEEYYDKGFRPNKSRDGFITPEVPDEFKFDFLRGLMDSDGCVKNHGNRHIEVNWLVNKPNVIEIAEMLGDIRYTITDCKGRTYSQIRVTRDKEVERLYHLMYDGDKLYMKRKRDRFVKWFEENRWKYKFNFNGREYKVRDQKEMADILGSTKNIVSHYLRGDYKNNPFVGLTMIEVRR